MARGSCKGVLFNQSAASGLLPEIASVDYS
jgi:hypothetical protein